MVLVTLDPKPQTLNPSTLNLNPHTRNPKPYSHEPISAQAQVYHLLEQHPASTSHAHETLGDAGDVLSRWSGTHKLSLPNEEIHPGTLNLKPRTLA